MASRDTPRACPYPVGVSDDRATWGIEPVPDRLRVLGLLDNGLLWGNLGVSLLVIVAGAALVPALSLPDALVAIVVGGLIGQVMLSAAAAIGAHARVPAMVLMRAPLGRRGSSLPTAVNVVQTLGWTVFELLVIATAAAALSDRLHEPYRPSPLLESIRAELPSGAVGATLSGSGPTVIVWAEDSAVCAAELDARFSDETVMSLDVSAEGTH